MSLVLTVQDRQAITELLSQYGLLTDQGRLDEWTAIFVEEADYVVPGLGSLRTSRDRLAMLEAAPRGLHLCSPPVISPGEVADSARAEQSFLFRNLETGQVITGWYEDQLVKRRGRWLIARRAIKYHRRPKPDG